jgi:hypothetical protein
MNRQEDQFAKLQRIARTKPSESDSISAKELAGREEINRIQDWQYYISKRNINPTESLHSFLQQDFIQNEHTKDAYNESYVNLWMQMNPGKTKEDGLFFLTDYRLKQAMDEDTAEGKQSSLRNILKMTPQQHMGLIESHLYDLEDLNNSRTRQANQALEVLEFRKSLEAYEGMDVDPEKSLEAHVQPHLKAYRAGHGDNLEFSTGSATTPGPDGNRLPAWVIGENENISDEYSIQRYLYPVALEHYKERMEIARRKLSESVQKSTNSMYEHIQDLPRDIATNVLIDHSQQNDGDNYTNLIDGIDEMVKRDIEEGKLTDMRDITNAFALYKEQVTDKLLERIKDHERI